MRCSCLRVDTTRRGVRSRGGGASGRGRGKVQPAAWPVGESCCGGCAAVSAVSVASLLALVHAGVGGVMLRMFRAR